MLLLIRESSIFCCRRVGQHNGKPPHFQLWDYASALFLLPDYVKQVFREFHWYE